MAALVADTTLKQLPAQNLDLVRLQLIRFDRAAAGHRLWAEDRGHRPGAKTCLQFLEGDQWKDSDVQIVADEGRSILTINKIGRLYRLVCGYQRKNRFDPAIEPTNDTLSDYHGAKIRSHLLKNVYSDNRYQFTESRMFDDGIGSGRGYVDIRLDFSKNIFGDIAITDRDPFRVYPDPDASTYDPAGWNFVIESSWMSLESILLVYGFQAYAKAQQISFDGQTGIVSTETEPDDRGPESAFGLYSWFNAETPSFTNAMGGNFMAAEHFDKGQKMIRVLSGQHREPRRVKFFVDGDTGALAEIPDFWDAERIQKAFAWAQAEGANVRIISRVEKRVRWVVTAGDVLLHNDWSPYEEFTIVPYFPYFRRGVTRGMIHDLVDPQREVNKRRSAIIHIIGTTANSGWQVWEGSLSAAEQTKLEQEGSAPGYIQIISKDTPEGRHPRRIEPGIPPTSMERMELAANVDLKEVSGINESSLGENDNAQSGVAIKNRQNQAVVGLELYIDNLRYSRVLIADRSLAIATRFYTEPRMVRMLNIKGEPEDQMINDISAVGHIANDITIGRYRAGITDVPAQDTFQARQFQELKEMVEIGAIPPILASGALIDASSIPYKEQLKGLVTMAQGMSASIPTDAPGGTAARPSPAGPPQ